MKKARQLNFEILRIVAMLMIVCLHYLGKGGALTPVAQKFGVNSYIAWLVEAFCYVSVNIYVLISGYFGSGSSFSLRKIARLWGQIIFYSVVIGIIMVTAMGLWQQMDIYTIFGYVFPVVTEHYWFATAYLVLYVMMPFLNAGFEMLEQKTVKRIILLLVCFSSVAKSVLPMDLPLDQAGYDILWFICLYLTGAYIREYRIGFLKRRLHGLVLYMVCAFATFAGMLVLRTLYLEKGMFDNMVTYTYSYNHLLCFVGAVGLFIACDRRGAGAESFDARVGIGKRMIYSVAGATFGVYLIHEHVNLRYQWPQWFECERFAQGSPVSFVLHMGITVIVVFVICALIEILRQKLFRRVELLWTIKEHKKNVKKEK